MYDMENFLNYCLTKIKGVGEVRAKLFAKLGVGSVGALLRYYPREYEDWSQHTTVFEAPMGQSAYILADVTTPVTEQRIRKGMTLYTCRAADENGTPIKLTFFNNPYIAHLLHTDRRYVFCGKITTEYGCAQMSSPTFLPEENAKELRPVYRQTEGLPSRLISQTVHNALAMLPHGLPDTLPSDILDRHSLMPLRTALEQIHFPTDTLSMNAARRRFIFEELLLLQLGLCMLKQRPRGKDFVAISADHTEEFFKMLPFSPTDAQRRAVRECMSDMMGGCRPMSRLLQGDVGSGKTAVAAALCFNCAVEGIQSAVMAPTEILAEQHYKTFSNLLASSGVNVALLTGSMTAAQKRAAREALQSGQAQVAVGTHALLSEGVEFASLGLVVTDEQHRFGVGQRAALCAKGSNPHLLVMSATPIPRTLALIIFGDLDISVLDQMPSGRKPVLTYWVGSDKRQRAYRFIKQHLDRGLQAYLVCPLVEESDADLASAEEYAMQLSSDEFCDYSVGLLHGRMRGRDKEYTMRRFAGGEISLLVSTTVIEVGVDVPNAVIMLIENAERFGLSQLHQLRGRVGRGSEQAYCILVSDATGETAAARLKTMTSTADGFKIAQEDLRLRGPGDFFGRRQHGLPQLNIADLSADISLLNEAQSAARDILADDPTLSMPQHAALKQSVSELFAETAIFN